MHRPLVLGTAALIFVALLAAFATQSPASSPPFDYIALADTQRKEAPSPAVLTPFDREILQHASRTLEEGRQIFRFDTFGDEAFWGDQLQLHRAIAGEKLGGVGPGVSPKTALAVGLKVDVDALPASLVKQLKAGQVDLDDPASTVALLKANAVVGVTGFFDERGGLRSVGIQCALCHSTVDDSLAPGIGRRLDGWPASDLNVGAIVALAPNLKPFADLLGVDDATVRKVLNSWGPGKYDAELNADGKAFRPDGKTAATLIPPAFGLLGVNNHTWSGSRGSTTYWNAYVANTQMHGQGVFFDARLNDPAEFPVAVKAGIGNKRDPVDLITAKLPALQFYQMSIPAPRAPVSSLNMAAVRRGEVLFKAQAGCATCHVPPIYTEPGWNLHSGAEIGIDDFQSDRSPGEKKYRTTPLRALFDTTRIHKGGFYHDGRFSTLREVVDHYDRFFKLGLTEPEENDLIEYLKSI
jgi:mono/diheme cytochrome c family protein